MFIDGICVNVLLNWLDGLLQFGSVHSKYQARNLEYFEWTIVPTMVIQCRPSNMAIIIVTLSNESIVMQNIHAWSNY